MNDMTLIVAAVIVTLIIITYVLYSLISQKVSAEKMAEIQMWVQIAVQAAEMIFVGSGRGEEKKAYVIEFLKKRGIEIDVDAIDAIVESTVLQLKQMLRN